MTGAAQRYKAEAEAQGVEMVSFVSVASEAIGRQWDPDKSAKKTVHDYMAVARKLEQMTEEMRGQ